MTAPIRPFTLKFLSFLIGLSIALSVAIFLKESTRVMNGGFGQTLLWQTSIWVPWIFALFAIERLTEVLEKQTKIWKVISLGATFLGLMVLHYILFFTLSNSISPLLGMEGTRFGVYRYFFIFWIMMDMVILWGLSVRLNVPEVVSDPPTSTNPSVIPVKKGGATIIIQPKEINWISAEDYYAKLHTVQGQFLVRKPLKILLRELPTDSFIQVHRSTIVNISFVGEAKKDKAGNNYLLMKDGMERAVSSAGLKRFKDLVQGNAA